MRGRRQTGWRGRGARALTGGAIACLAIFVLSRLLTDRAVALQWVWWVPPWAWAAGTVGLVAMSRAMDRRRRPARRVALAGALVALGVVICADWRAYRALAAVRSDSGRSASLLFLNLAAERIDDASELALPDVDVYVIANASSATGLDPLARRFDEPPFVAHAWPFVVVSRWPVARLGATVFRAHGEPDARSDDDPGRAAAFSLEGTPAGDLTLWVVDFPSDPRRSRVEIARRAAEAVGAAPRFPAPDLVVGDFNITRGSHSLRCFVVETAPGLRDAHALAGLGPAGTWPRRAPLWPIDHALVGPRLRPIALRTVDPGVGSHRAIVVRVEPGGP